MDTNKTKSSELLQSSKVTQSGISFSRMQKRFLYEIIARIQSMYQGISVKGAGIIPFDAADALATTFVVPISDVIGRGSKNHTELKASLRELFSKMIVIGDNEKGWSVRSYFDSIEIPAGQGVIRARMTLTFFEEMANLTKGLTVFNYHVAKELPSSYSMNMYEYISRWNINPPRTVPVEELRNILGCNERIKNPDGKIVLIRKFDTISNFSALLKQIKKNLDDPKYCSPYKFDFEPKKEGRKTIAFKITVHKEEDFINDSEKKRRYDAEHGLSLSMELSPELVAFMKNTLEWDETIIRKNLRTLKAYKRYFGAADLYVTLSKLYSQTRNRKNIRSQVGVIIDGLKSKMLKKGITVNADGTVSLDEEKMKAFLTEEQMKLMIDKVAKQMAQK